MPVSWSARRPDLRDHRVPARAGGRGPRHRRRDRRVSTMTPRGIRSRIPAVKLVASAITIGSGGSGGREGPTAQIGAGFGSYLARLLDLDARDARIAVSSGMGAGIGAIFRAPLGGAVLAAEIPYREDVESEALVPAFVASIVAFSIFGAIVGFAPIFGRVAGARLHGPAAARLLRTASASRRASSVGCTSPASTASPTWFARGPCPASSGRRIGRVRRRLHRHCRCRACSGTGYGWVQAGLDRYDAARTAAVGRPRPAVREDPRHLAVDRVRRLGRHLRPGHGHRRACSAPASGACSSRGAGRARRSIARS